MSQGCTVPIKTSAESSTTSLGINLLVMRDTGVWLHGSVTLPQFRLTEDSAYHQLLSQGKWLQTFITVSVSSLHQSQDQVQLLSSSNASMPSRDIWNMQAYARDRTATNSSPRTHSHKTWSCINVFTRTQTDRQTDRQERVRYIQQWIFWFYRRRDAFVRKSGHDIIPSSCRNSPFEVADGQIVKLHPRLVTSTDSKTTRK